MLLGALLILAPVNAYPAKTDFNSSTTNALRANLCTAIVAKPLLQLARLVQLPMGAYLLLASFASPQTVTTVTVIVLSVQFATQGTI
jgi:hypothetical protein